MPSKVDQAVSILASLDLPRAQHNERSALCLLALLNLLPDADWGSVKNPLMGVTPIMSWVREHYGREYAGSWGAGAVLADDDLPFAFRSDHHR